MPENGSVQSRARKYNASKRRALIASFALVFGYLLLLALWARGAPAGLVSWLATAWPDPLFWIVLILWLGARLLTFPLDLYSGYLTERRYQLTRLTLLRWAGRYAKGSAVSFVILYGAAWGIRWAMSLAGALWWVLAAAGAFAISALATRFLPTLLIRIFHRLAPVPDLLLREKLADLAERCGIETTRIQMIAFGQYSPKANAFRATWMLLLISIAEKLAPPNICAASAKYSPAALSEVAKSSMAAGKQGPSSVADQR